MLKPGIYKCEPDGARGVVTIRVKETEKSYVFTLIDMLFAKSGRAVIPRDKPSPHAIPWKGDGWFTIYPYRAGIPFLFNLAE